MKNKTECLIAPCTGKTLPLSLVPDEVFAGELLGKGIAVEPSQGHFFAPVSGTLTSVTDSRHAYTLMSENGVDILLHIGVDTVGLAGEGFVSHVTAGERIRAGQLIAEADIELIRSRGLSAICSLVVTETDKIENIEYKPGACIGGKNAVMCYTLTGKGSL
jgi:glucose-specific phosphotransferase system IIA component